MAITDTSSRIEELDCVHSVVDPSKNGVNKHRYVCAINDDEVRSSLRDGIQVVPLLYIRRSVLIMEPASSTTVKARSRDEKAKFTAELKSPGMKRKRQQEDTDDTDDEKDGNGKEDVTEPSKPKRKTYGRKEPNPLSVRKKKKEDKSQHMKKDSTETAEAAGLAEVKPDITTQPETGEAPGRKRRRKHKSKTTDAARKDDDIQVKTLTGDE